MKMVYLVAEKSRDPKTKIGAVLVKDKHIISTGYNGFPIGVKDLPERYNNRETKLKYVSHAESNAILSCARFGISSMGSILFTNGTPCQECCKDVIQGGIKEIVIHGQWPEMTHSNLWVESVKISKTMLEECNINVRIFDKFLDVNGYLDGKVIRV